MMDENQFKKLLVSLGERRVEQKQGTLERHAQTGLTALVVILLSTFGAGLWAMNQTQNDLVTGQQIFTLQVGSLAKKIEEQNSIYVQQIDFALHKQSIEVRLQKLEQKSYGGG